MKSSASPRRPVRKQVRLDLRRAASPPPPDDEVSTRRNRSFWRWFGIVALLHVLLFIVVVLLFHDRPAPPPEQFISLEPFGQNVQGTPGEQSAPKVGTSTPAPSHHHHHSHPMIPTPQPTPPPVTPPSQPVTPPPTPPPAAVQPPPPTPVPTPVPVVKQETAPPIPKKKIKPKPVKPKIKVDLTLQSGPTPTPEKPVHKHIKKTSPAQTADQNDDDNRDSADNDTTGLSKEQVAAKLGQKLKESGTSHSNAIGQNGSPDGSKSPFADFYQSIHDQVMEKWQYPNQDDLQATEPVVQIHVEADGRVPADQVTLLRSSGNQAIDDSALGAAKSIGYTLQPLPDGCPPDISINFKLHH